MSVTVHMPIGIVGPFTGPRAEYGDLLREAAFYGAALARRRWRGGQRPRLLLENDAADPATACEAARRLIGAGVEVVVGHLNSDAAAAAGPLYRTAGIPLLLPAATRDGLAYEIGALRLCPTDAEQIRALAVALSGTDIIALAADETFYAARLKAGLRAHPLLAGRIRQEVELRDDAPRAADAVVFLGTHHSVLEALGRWTDSRSLMGCRLLACDDCSLVAFRSFLPAGVKVEVASPEPDFASAVRNAVTLAIGEAQGGHFELAKRLAAHPLFHSNGECRNGRFQIVEVSSRLPALVKT